MDDDTDLRGLDLQSAKEYVFAFAVEAKRLDKEVAAAESELALWRGRAELASGKGMADLAAAARAKAGEVEGKLASLRAERSDMRSKLEAMRLQLPAIRARERSVDPDRLLAELQLMTGELLGEDTPGEDTPGEEAPGASDAGAADGQGGAAPPAGAAARPSAAALGRDFARLEADAKADADLAALKQKLGDSNSGGQGSGS
jgi:phage shock protein A